MRFPVSQQCVARSLVLILFTTFCLGVSESTAQYVDDVTVASGNVEANGNFGETVVRVGDLNGDSTPDFVVGAPSETVAGNGGAGRVYFVSGADGSRFGTALESPNVDFQGAFGGAVAPIGNVVGDDTPDLLVGAPGEQSGGGTDDAGRAYIVDGATGSTQPLGSGNVVNDGEFGAAVASVGDVGGDATPDLIVGAPGEVVDFTSEAGRAYLIDGSNGDILHELESSSVGNVTDGGAFGAAVAGVGDVGGDSTPDVLVGAPGEKDTGRAYIIDGSDGTILRTFSSPVPSNGGSFGNAVAAPGDLGGDSSIDFLIGAEGEPGGGPGNAGRVYVIDGADGSELQRIRSLDPQTGGFFGGSISVLQDVVGDATVDFLVGAAGEDTDDDGDPSDDQGRAYIVDGADGTVVDMLESPNVSNTGTFGASVAGLGDLDGNGIPEIAIGASGEVGGAGQAYTFVVPEISFVDGRNGESYDPENASSDDSDVPVARFKLSSTDARSTLESVTISNEGSTVSGANSIELWRSVDNSFETSTDTPVEPKGTFSAPATFSDLNTPISESGTYFFIVVDMGSSPNGAYDPAIASDLDIGFDDGQLFRVNGTQTGTFSVSGNGDGYLSAGPTSPLPVELTTFEATSTEDGVSLRWQTASETNNAGFRVQRRDGTTGEWTTVGREDSKATNGTTTQATSYQFADPDVPYQADTLRYRLAQVDLDGTVNYSESVSVARGAVGQVELLGTYPNPAQASATLRYAVPAGQEATIHLYDVLGQQVRTVAAEATGGRTTTQLDVSGLASGVYLLRLTAGGTTKTQRLTVVR